MEKWLKNTTKTNAKLQTEGTVQPYGEERPLQRAYHAVDHGERQPAAPDAREAQKVTPGAEAARDGAGPARLRQERGGRNGAQLGGQGEDQRVINNI